MLKYNQEVHLDQNLSIKTFIIPKDMAFSSSSSDKNQSSQQYCVSEEMIEKIYNSIKWDTFMYVTSVIYLVIRKRRGALTDIRLDYSTDNSETKLRRMDSAIMLSISTDSPVFVPFLYFSKTQHDEKIKFHFKYYTEGKSKDADASLSIQTKPPLKIEFSSCIRVGTIGVYCNCGITNTMGIPIYRLSARFHPSSFLVPLDEGENVLDSVEIEEKDESDSSNYNSNNYNSSNNSSNNYYSNNSISNNEVRKVMPNNTYSKVFMFEFVSKNKRPSGKCNIGSLSAKFSVKSNHLNNNNSNMVNANMVNTTENYGNFDGSNGQRFEINFPNTFELVFEATDQFPLSVEMIGSPQTASALVPFAVKVVIHNDGKKTEKFKMNILSDPDNCLVPYGSHFIDSVIAAGESPRFDMTFVGLKQGLLLYPSFLIELEDKSSKKFIQEGGVFVVKDSSVIYS